MLVEPILLCLEGDFCYCRRRFGKFRTVSLSKDGNTDSSNRGYAVTRGATKQICKKSNFVLVRSPKVNSELSLPDDEKRSAWDFEMNNMKHADNMGYHNDAYM